MDTELVAEAGHSKPWSRVLILFIFLIVASALCHHITGSFVPSDAKHSLIFQGGLLLVVMGSALLEHKFTKPADSAVNALVGMVTLLPVHSLVSGALWWAMFLYCFAVFCFAITCVMVSSGISMSRTQQGIAAFTYRPAVLMGKSRVLYSLLFLFGLLSFESLQSKETLLLLLFWGAFVVVWPLKIPELLSGLSRRPSSPTPVGRIVRIDAPNIVRVALEPTADWTQANAKVCQQPDGTQTFVFPLYSQVIETGTLGTGLCAGSLTDGIARLTPGYVYEGRQREPLSDAQMAKWLCGDETARLVGFVVEDSAITDIRFEVLRSASCKEGAVVWCQIGGERVYYQITNGVTREETLESDRHGYQIATAVQLGTLDRTKGFSKFEWLPGMNTPIFSIAKNFGDDIDIGADGDFAFGVVPETKMRVVGSLIDALEYHTAILGVTGSGKTELAFDIIRAAVAAGVKVICIDLTAQYADRLSNLTPCDLSISGELSEDLGQKLFDAETGAYGGGKEKKVLSDFSEQLKGDVEKSISAFLLDKSEGTRIGLIQLDEISNTQATLFITELYLTCLLRFARENKSKCPRVLLVVEEAHTVMPEPSTMGLSDYNSKALVAKISQVALQGRKFGVGLLVVAQRTATVSKSVLTQCNTVISFTCFDDTSLGFLKNIFGQEYTTLIPALPPLNAVAFGKGVRSERPIIVEIPYDEEKAKLSRKPEPAAAAAKNSE